MPGRAAELPAVLLVESAEDDRVMYAEYLRRFAFRPLEAADTRRALTLAESADVIVTDVRVGGPFDGIEFVRRLRAAPRTREKAVIVLTACAFEWIERRAYDAGCDLFLPKPCLPDALASEIRRMLRRRGQVLH